MVQKELIKKGLEVWMEVCVGRGRGTFGAVGATQAATFTLLC